MSRVAAVILAAGAGRRMGADRNKVLLPLGGRAILARTLDVFARHPAIGPVVLVGDRAELAPIAGPEAWVVAGGSSRHGSERNGVLALSGLIEAGEVGTVLVHDAARPFVSGGEIDRLLDAVSRSGAAILAARVDEAQLVLLHEDGSWHRPGGPLWAAQTPQGFEAGLVLAAHRRAASDGFEGTDTASVVERQGHPVRIVEGSPANIKITTPGDLALAESILDLWEADPDAASRRVPHV